MGLALAVPDYSTLSRRQGALAVVLPKKQTASPASPMHLVVDSTGLKVYGEGEWKVRQHGWSMAQTAWNEATGEVVAQTLTSHRIDDASQPPCWLKSTRRWGRSGTRVRRVPPHPAAPR